MNKRHLLTMSFALACASVFAETVDFGGLKFNLTPDGKAVLTSGKAALGTVVIPHSVRGHKVTEIKANAFQGNTDIRSIIIPATVQRIGACAFYDCKELSKVEMHSTADRIEDFVFAHCEQLESISLPQGITNIGRNAFENCTSLKNVDIPRSCESIDSYAFNACSSLEYITLPENLHRWSAEAFLKCKALRSVYYLGNNVPEVHSNTFSGADGNLAVYVKPILYDRMNRVPALKNKVRVEFPLEYSSYNELISKNFAIDFSSAPAVQAMVTTGFSAQHNRENKERVHVAVANEAVNIQAGRNRWYFPRIADDQQNDHSAIRKVAQQPMSFYYSKTAPIEGYMDNSELLTDKTIYNPGETVHFTSSRSLAYGSKVYYYHGADVVDVSIVGGNSWTWKTPQEDFKGYLAVVTEPSATGYNVVSTVGVDVSTKWTKFPRYGYIANYDPDSKTRDMKKEMETFRKYHINAMQFYDWQWKHHRPYCPNATYNGIFNETISAQVVKDYIREVQGIGSKAMFYNLAYGALKDGKEDGVKPEWQVYIDSTDVSPYRHVLEHGKSDIFIQNPANVEWQDYLVKRTREVYQDFKFDGFHVDQLGSAPGYHVMENGNKVGKASRLSTKDGKEVLLWDGYSPLLTKLHNDQEGKELVMNQVSNWGHTVVATNPNIHTVYVEVWWKKFAAFSHYMEENQEVAPNKPVVFAAYTHYKGAQGAFNIPSVLVSDAFIFAIGGSRIELSGNDMLNNPYFPNTDCYMTDELRAKLVPYYNFLVGYENLLRDNCKRTYMSVRMNNKVLPFAGKEKEVNYYCAEKDNKLMIHLLNLETVKDTSWIDKYRTTTEPKTKYHFTVDIDINEDVARVWAATPDVYGGTPQDIPFKKKGNKLYIEVPSLKYWTMLVVEKGASNGLNNSDEVVYVNKNNAWERLTVGTINSNETYIKVPLFGNKHQTRTMSLINSNNETLQSAFEKVATTSEDESYYTIDGVKVERPGKGIYIHKGKKVFIK